jgi:hypothetical protein
MPTSVKVLAGEFHGYGLEAPLETLKKYLKESRGVELFPVERVVFLNIPFGELYHRCTTSEWDEFSFFLASQRLPIKQRPWWRFWQ